MPSLTDHLARWLEAGGREVGEIAITFTDAGYELRHRDDCGRGDLAEFRGAEAARELANSDDAGKFRPLKTAPTLRRGWRLVLADVSELHRALDYFYPAMLGLWVSHIESRLAPGNLRPMLARQTGMYRVTQKLTDDQAQTMIGRLCRSDGGCLKHLLWRIDDAVPITTLPPEKLCAPAPFPALPLLCHEACNLLISEARSVVKKSESPA
jgi:sirohydrochlorin cobaltochelatase